MSHRQNALSTASSRVIAACAIAPLLGLFGAGLVQAQTAAAAPKAASDAIGVQDIVVTAQKRSEPLLKVPVSVQVVAGQTLQNENTNSLTDLAQVMPEVHIQSSGDQYGSSLAIRGISSGASNPAYDQSVAIFSDDIYYGRSAMTQSAFLDLDHIEVLSGPQSTYFGNNAVAGALNIQTKKPGDTYEGYLRALGGSYGAYALEGAASLPVSDTLSFRVAGTANGDTGWIKNVNTGKMAPGEQNYAGRVTARWAPTSQFDAVLKVEGSSNLITGAYSETPAQWDLCPTPSGIKINNFCPYVVATNTAVPGSVPTGFNNNLNSGLPGQFSKLTTNSNALTMNYHVAGLTFTSVTGYYDYSYVAHEDNASVGSLWLSTSPTAQTFWQFSQEARVTSPADQTVDFMVGGYYQIDHLRGDIEGTSPFFNPLLGAFFTPAQLPTGFEYAYAQNETIWSGFAAVNWHITSQLTLNLGFRATDDSKGFVGTTSYGMAPTPYGPLTNNYTPFQQAVLGSFLGKAGTYPYSRDDKAVMPSVGLQYQVTPATMAYATYTRGFLAGGFSVGSFSPLKDVNGNVVNPEFNPEYVDAFEVGLKGKWFDNRVLISMDYFHETFKDIQVSAQVALSSGISTTVPVNAGGSLSQGVEVHGQWVVTQDFNIIADVTYLDAHYTTFSNAPPTFEQLAMVPAPVYQNLKNKPLDFSPDWSGSVTAEYRIHLPADYELIGSLTPIFTSSYYNSAGTDDPLFLIPGSVRLDGKLTLNTPWKNLSFDVIGKNLTNAVIPLSIGGKTAQGGKEEPLNIAAQVRYQW